MFGLKTMDEVLLRALGVSADSPEVMREQLLGLRDAQLQQMVKLADAYAAGQMSEAVYQLRSQAMRVQAKIVARGLNSCVLKSRDSLFRVVKVDLAPEFA